MTNEDVRLDEVVAEMAELEDLLAYLRSTTPAEEQARMLAKS